VEEVTSKTLGPLGAAKQQLDVVVGQLNGLKLEPPRGDALKAPIAEAQAALDAMVSKAKASVDTLTKDYEEDLKKISAAEEMARKVDPDFDVPDPNDLKGEIDAEVAPIERKLGEASAAIDAQMATLTEPFSKVAEAHSSLTKLVDSFAVPSADSVLAPLRSVRASVQSAVSGAKVEVPTAMDEVIATTPTGRAASDSAYFTLVCVYAPLAAIILLNGTAALVTALSAMPASATAAASSAAGLLPSETAVSDVTADSAAVTSIEMPSVAVPSMDLSSVDGSSSQVPSVDVSPVELPLDEMSSPPIGLFAAFAPYVKPVLVQAVLLAIQMVLTFLMTRKPVIVGTVNVAICGVEEELNGRINTSIKAAVTKIFGEALDVVRAKAAALVDSLRGSISAGEMALTNAASVESLAKVAAEAQAQVEAAAKQQVDAVMKEVEEAQGRVQHSRELMEGRIKEASEAANAFSDPSKALGAIGDKFGF